MTGVRVRFGNVEINTVLKERETAEEEYKEAKRSGRQAALVTRESPDVFTLAIAGIHAGEDIVVRTEYIQLAKPEGKGWSLRVPLTTSPRYVRSDESNSRHAEGQPLAIMRDPGHRFSLTLTCSDADRIASNTHALMVSDGQIRLRDGEVLPDRDCIIIWQPKTDSRPALSVWSQSDSTAGNAYFLALCVPPKDPKVKKVPREVILLVDHSGSMEGPKWEAADWAVERFLSNLEEQDSFALGLFHDTTNWFAKRPQKATAKAVHDAIAFLRKNRDSAGTELGVALEQALDRSRTADTPSRHVLIITDAEVSDAGRILRLAEAESAKADRRRVSVLCIDSAPNEALACQLAERGGGVSRFLTSNPDEDDVTTALDEVLADWSAPVLTGLTLEVNRVGAEVVGRTVSLITPGPASGIDIGDLPAGRPVWVIGRVPSGSSPISFRLRAGAEVVAENQIDMKREASGLKALFGADRIRRLEYVTHANFSGDEFRTELSRFGHDVATALEAKVSAENSRETAAKVVRELLVRESLACGLPCSETAFIAVRSEIGQPVTETQIVANALPHGWSDKFVGGGSQLVGVLCCSALSDVAVESVDSMLCDFSDDVLDDEDSDTTTDFDALRIQGGMNVPPAAPMASSVGMRGSPVKLDPGLIQPLRSASARGARAVQPKDVRISIAPGQLSSADGAVLYDSSSGDPGSITFISVAFVDKSITAGVLDPDLTFLLFVGDIAAPRARVKLVDLLRLGGRRPLNLRRDADQVVRLVLVDPSGAWKGTVPGMEIVLGWKA